MAYVYEAVTQKDLDRQFSILNDKIEKLAAENLALTKNLRAKHTISAGELTCSERKNNKLARENAFLRAEMEKIVKYNDWPNRVLKIASEALCREQDGY